MEGIATIYTVNLKDWQDGAHIRRLLAYLPDEVRTRAATYRSERDADRRIVSDALKRVAACMENGLRLNEIELFRDGFGKPSLKGFPDYFFNVSHSMDWVVCAVSAKGMIGVDVERVGGAEAEAAELCFTPRELAEWKMQPPERRDAFFFELWTLKESYAKAVGQGLSIGLSSLETIRHQETAHIMRQGRVDSGLRLRLVPLDPDYKCAVCMPADERTVQCRRLFPDEMLACMKSFDGHSDSDVRRIFH
ncbi:MULTISPECIES: 4'-phosphopantetheinyl transferase family protein [Paenibacillus]|uniref:4'-phosphopantetheinyl transferase n=1 Tax=Paenibacillus albilobatus TaxID=2716884 RepID=A0A919XMW0_9BACL|nr:MULTISPECIES: 4'-phosphopantetheinyl transferase superfamily protein [Paenibacillus]GIO33335.1 4'-phosphopantetheinyl transferase [Paenibacillus albilobatus]